MANAELKKQLAGVDLSFVAKLDDSDENRLVELLKAAQTKQAESLKEASEQSLKHVPALLRGTVRKLLF